ncbi:putative F-box domain, leucine-rich repeat domain, L domain-containing protein [Medicago truncatula]|uniref:Putative F-box domain, leucine-rich repeat domain, L domain-containing protein n=1 Tax=Medicago truncatula TaxID=3880 RepID=A0A396IV88_MEDTR|nr:putative F-box domain, leucine-rich repeat domain, L domain-containing protein [Medicago truncatula]
MAQNFDMISLLPDTLLFIIISLIPFKEAVRTSILSKRWLHLWKNTTNIEFNEHFFVGSEFQRWDFLHFITLCIENYQENSIVEKLSLTLADPGHVTSSEIVERCVDFAIQQGVIDLDLDFSSPYWTEEDIEEPEALFELRTKVYENKTLKSLKLFSCNFPENELMKFHALKEVSLGWMELKNNAIETLLSNCKMIEILNIKKCWTWNRIDCVGVDELRLKKLIVDSCFFMEGGFLIDAPNLTYFKFHGNIMYFDIDYSSHLEEVDLYFGLEYENPKEDVFIYSTIRNFKYVKVLTICGFILKEMERISTLFELRHLKMNTRHLKMMTNLQSDECLGVRFFLNSCTMLELLTFDLGSGRLIHVSRYIINKI